MTQRKPTPFTGKGMSQMVIGVAWLKAVWQMPKPNRRINTVILSKRDTALAQALSKRLIRGADQSWDIASAIESARDGAAIYGPENHEGVAMYAVHHAFALGTASLMLCAAGADELALGKDGNVWLRIPWEGWVRAGRKVNPLNFVSELRGRIAKAEAEPQRGDPKNNMGGLGTFDIRIYGHGDRIISVSRNRRNSSQRANAVHSARQESIIMLANSDTRESAISVVAEECKTASTLLISDRDNEVLQFGPNACAAKELPSPLAFMTMTDSVPDALVHASAARRDSALLREWARMGVRVFVLSNEAGFDELTKELGSEPNFEIRTLKIG